MCVCTDTCASFILLLLHSTVNSFQLLRDKVFWELWPKVTQATEKTKIPAMKENPVLRETIKRNRIIRRRWMCFEVTHSLKSTNRISIRVQTTENCMRFVFTTNLNWHWSQWTSEQMFEFRDVQPRQLCVSVILLITTGSLSETRTVAFELT